MEPAGSYSRSPKIRSRLVNLVPPSDDIHQGLKPTRFAAFSGTTKVVPFQNPDFRPSCQVSVNGARARACALQPARRLRCSFMPRGPDRPAADNYKGRRDRIFSADGEVAPFQ